MSHWSYSPRSLHWQLSFEFLDFVTHQPGSCTILRYKVIQIAAQHVQDGMSWVNGGPNRLRTDNGSSQTTGADAGLDPRPRDKISRKIESPLTLRDTSAVLENSL